MKEIFTELQEKYGQDFEYLPNDFSYDEYIEHISKELGYETPKKSNCCGVNLDKIANDKTGATWEDYGICPNCLDNC